MTFTPGDRVHWVDDPNRLGTVLKVAGVSRRDPLGQEVHHELPPMVFVQWDRTLYGKVPGRKHWETPELLRKVES